MKHTVSLCLALLLALCLAGTAAATELPDRGLLTSALARALDPRLSPACARALRADTVAALCDPGRQAPRLSAGGFAMRRARGAVVLTGRSPLDARSRVTVGGLRATRHAQLIVLYRLPTGAVYARFGRLPRAVRRLMVAARRAGGAIQLRIVYGRHRIRPLMEKTLLSKAAADSAPPEGTTSAAAASTPSPPPAGSPSPPLGCGTSPVGATCDSGFDTMWQLKGPGWTGGDGALSVPLPDGRVAWLFGDTFLGTISADGTRPRSSPFVHNSTVVQSGGELTTLAGPGDTALIGADQPGRWYWPAHGVVEGSSLRVFMLEFEANGQAGPYAFNYLGTYIATFSLPDLTYQGLTPVPGSGSIAWGGWVMNDGPWTYIYGDNPIGADSAGPRVARVPRGGLLGPWEYFTGAVWTSSPDAALPLAVDVPNQYSVVPVGGGYAMISMGRLGDPRMFARFAAAPTGPFGPSTLLYTAPASSAISVYNAVAHPEHTEGGRLLVSYSVNAVNGDDLYTHPEYYRPRFVRVPLSALGG